MEVLAKELDKIEINIQMIPDNIIYKPQLLDELRLLREEFETQQSVHPIIKAKIINLSSRVTTYIEHGKNPIEDKIETLKAIEKFIPGNEDKPSILVTDARLSKEKNDISIFQAYLEKIDFSQNPENIQKAIKYIEDKYETIGIYSQSLEQKISELKYRLMTKFMRDKDIERATTLSKEFSTDMRIYIVNRLKAMQEKLLKAGQIEFVEKINGYIYDDNLDESDLKLWELILQVENPNLNYTLSQSTGENGNTKEQESVVDTNLPSISEKKNFFSRLMQNVRIGRKNNVNQLKTYTIRCDSKNNGINLKDLKKFYQSIVKNPNEKCRLVFDEGIKEIELPNMSIKVGKKEIRVGHYSNDFFNCVQEIVLPTTAVTILNYTFAEFNSIQEVDLSRTHITSIGDGAFWRCDNLARVICPRTLEKIGTLAFNDCDKLTEIIGGENLKSIGDYAIPFSQLTAESLKTMGMYERGLMNRAVYSKEDNKQKKAKVPKDKKKKDDKKKGSKKKDKKIFREFYEFDDYNEI